MDNTNKYLKITLLSILVWLGLVRAFAQPRSNVIPPSPNAASLSKYGDIPVNLSAGIMNLQIPIYTASEGGLNWPINISYNYTGYRPSEEISWVGRGWNLPVGVITRTVHGVSDENHNDKNGYLVTGPSVKANVDSYINNNTVDYTFLQGVGAGNNDAEPDIFQFAVGKYSGSFFFGHDGKINIRSGEPLKITFERGVPSDGSGHNFVGDTFMKWIITGEDGTQYIFSDKEYSWSLSINQTFDRFDKTVSAWHLSEIIGPKGENIKFTYTSATAATPRIQMSYSQNRTVPMQATNPNCSFNFQVAGTVTTIQRNYSEEVHLTKIEASNFRIDFNSSQYSKSINNETSYFRKLDKIVVNDISSGSAVQVRSFDFTYGSIDKDALIQLQEKNGTTALNPYKLYYNVFANSAVTSMLTTSVDYWGYYNAAANNNNLTVGADRQPSVFYTKYGALIQLIYPTGGYAYFDYELNTAGYVQQSLNTQSTEVNQYYTFVWTKNANGSIVTAQDSPFPVGISATYEATYSLDHDPNEPCIPLFKSGTLNAGNYSASYFLPAQCALDNLVSNGTITCVVRIISTSALTNQPVGGLRIKNIIHAGLDGGTQINKNYYYNDFTNGALSSGSLSDAVVPYGISTLQACSSTLTARIYRAEPINSVSLAPVLYFNVEERLEDRRQFYYFTSFDSYLDNNGQVIPPGGSDIFGPRTSFEFARGLKKKEIASRSSASDKAYESLTQYPDQAATTIYSAPAIYMDVITTINQPTINTIGQYSQNVVYLKIYKVIAGWVRKNSEQYTDFGTSGSGITQNTNYTYNNPLHKQITRQRSTQSDGSILEINYRYPQDFANPTGTIPAMIASNMIANPLEITQIMEKSPSDRRYIDAEVTIYHTYDGKLPATKPTLILPYSKYRYNGFDGSIPYGSFGGYDGSENVSGSYRQVLKYTQYDKRGNPIATLVNNSEKVAYLWSYKGQYPVAEIKNADETTVLPALGGIQFEDMADLVESPSIQSKILSVKTALTGSLVNGYLYKPLIGRSMSIAPNGITTSYEYDLLGRLLKIKNHNSETIKSYKYNNGNQPY